MKYALLIYPGELTSASERLSEEERESILGEYMALMQEPGVLGAEQLQPPESATTVPFSFSPRAREPVIETDPRRRDE